MSGAEYLGITWCKPLELPPLVIYGIYDNTVIVPQPSRNRNPAGHRASCSER
jgi:hypothetical protein